MKLNIIRQLLSFLDTVTILVRDFTNPNDLNEGLLILNSMTNQELQTLTLVGPSRENIVPDPLAEHHLDN